MSFSKSMRGSLARSYASVQKKSEKYTLFSSDATKSSVACVFKKIEQKEQKEQKEQLYRSYEVNPPLVQESTKNDHVLESTGSAQRYIATDRPAPSATGSTGSGAMFSDSDNVLEASAVSTKSSQERLGLAHILTDPKRMWVEFFSGLVTDDAADAVVDAMDDGRPELEYTDEEAEYAKKKVGHRFAIVCNFSIKLVLVPLKSGRRLAGAFASLLDMQYGPLHASLQVRDLVLEWDDSSLVTPYLCDHKDKLIEVDMQAKSKWMEHIDQHTSKMKAAAERLDCPEEIKLIYTVTSKKKELIDNLIEVIVKYNKHYYYNLFDRNCQHFVSDALKALEVERPAHFTGRMKEYFESLRKGRTPSVPDKFKTHCDLDKYVLDIKRKDPSMSMPQHDLEFILNLYFHFHLESKLKASGDWKCKEGNNCCISTIEECIKMESMRIHKFKPISS